MLKCAKVNKNREDMLIHIFKFRGKILNIYETQNKMICRVMLEKQETENMEYILNHNLNIANLELCYFFEQLLPKKFEVFKDKRVMIMDISKNGSYLNVIVMVQNVDIEFQEPKHKKHLFTLSTVVFENEEEKNRWKQDIVNNNIKIRYKEEGLMVNLKNTSVQELLNIVVNYNVKVKKIVNIF